MNKKTTIANRVNHTKFGLKTKSIDEIVEIIHFGDMRLYDAECGSYTLRTITEAIRNEPDPQRQKEWKERFLPVVTFNGIWDGKKICEYSNFTALDFDHISNDDELRNTLALLKTSPFVAAIFRTFKPKRIKALVMHDNTDPMRHKEMYEQLIDLFSVYGIDESCKDLSRKTYLPWDEHIWGNPGCSPYHFIPDPICSRGSMGKQFVSSGKGKSSYSIINILNSSWRKNHPEYWQEGYRAMSIFKCACQFCEYGVPQDMAEEYFYDNWTDMERAEVLKHVRGAYSSATYGSRSFF